MDEPKVPKPMVSSPAGGPPSTVHDIPNHVLELILLRLDSSISLVRAESACKRWHRVVADAGFQGRFRRRNGATASSSSWATTYPDAAARPSHRQSFDLDFVPKVDGCWQIADGRGRLLLLRKRKWKKWDRRLNPDLVVCEPLTRRYRAISVLPDILGGCQDLGLFLLEGGGLSDFKFMAVLLTKVRGRGVPSACVYSQRDGTWHGFNCAWEGNRNIPSRARNFVFTGRANGSLYWGILGGGGGAHAALALDEATARVSQVALPDGVEGWHHGRFLRMIGGEDDGTLRAVCLIDSELRVFARLHGGAGWVLENHLLQLLDDPIAIMARPMIVAAHEMYVLVAPKHSQWLFCIDLKTMAVGRLRRRNVYKEWLACPYELPWPPVLNA